MMIRLKFCGVLLLFAVTGFAAEAFGQNTYHRGWVQVPETHVYTSSSTKSSSLGKLKRGAEIRVYGKKDGRFYVQFQRNMETVHGWINQRDVRVGKRVRPQQTIVRPTERAYVANRETPEHALGGLRVFTSPIFNVRRFGATQIRGGAGYAFSLGNRYAIGAAASYSFLGGFSSIQGGPEIFFKVLDWQKLSLYTRLGLFFERFSGDGRSFLAGTVDLGFGVDYHLKNGLFIVFEPASLEVSPITTKDIPWFMRAQGFLGVRIKW